MLYALALGVALWWDHAFGEPPLRWHPVAWIGHYLGGIGPSLCRLRPAAALAGGIGAWAVGAVGVVALAWGLQQALLVLAGRGGAAAWLLAAVLMGAALKPLFAARMLRDEVQAVEAALAQGLPAARVQLSRIVSRDTATLDEAEVREAALETLAENLNDSVVAPLMWFAVAGLPGAALYRYANTADAMWGYRGRWEWVGKAAARIDDLLSWLPARVTAALLLGLRRPAWRRLPAEARRTPSPNGGWPMGALALRLGVRLRKPGVYALNDQAREPAAADARLALRWAAQATLASAALFAAARVALEHAA